MKRFHVVVNGNSYEVEVEELAPGMAASPLAAPVMKSQVAAPTRPAPAKQASDVPVGASKVTAPMPGKIVSIALTVGQEVKEGELVCILEAMKMENEVFASATGRVASVNVNPGDLVETGDVIVAIN